MKKCRYLPGQMLIAFVLLFNAWNVMAQTQLGAPSRLTATATAYNQVNLAWQSGSAGTETGFEIYRDPGLGTNYTLLTTVGKNITSYQDKSVSGLSNYNYRVRAYTTAQKSNFSNDAMVQTPVPPPNTPNTLVATLKNDNTIHLTWNGNNSLGTSFYLERVNRSAGGTFSQIAVVNYDRTLVYDDAGLSSGIQYCYRVRAHNTSGDSGFSNESCASTPTSTPEPPARLAATAVSSSRIDLSWADVSNNETGFELERETNSSGTFVRIADLGANTSSFSDQPLSTQTRYCYRIRSKNGAGSSSFAGPVCATTQAPELTAPVAPSQLTIGAVTSNSIELSWTDNANNEAGFELEKSTDGRSFTKIADLGPDVKSYKNEGLSSSTRYWYRILAQNAAGRSGYSNTADATTSAPPVSAPRPPSGLTANAISGTQIALSWTDNANNEEGFQLERSTDGNNFDKIQDLSANTTSYNDAGVAPKTKYWYRVLARNSGGASGYSNVAEATTPDVGPVAPTQLSATTVSYERINLSWNDASGNESGFELERSTDGNNFQKIAGLGANVTSFQDMGLAASTQYYYRVKAYNAIGSSNYSNVAQAVTARAPVPDQPKNLIAIPLEFDLVQLSWSPLSENATGVVIERSTKPDQGFVQIGNQAAANVQFPDHDVLNKTDYYYRIKALNAAGSSPYSDVFKLPVLAIITGTEPSRDEDLIYLFDDILYVTLKKPAISVLRIFNKMGLNVKTLSVVGTCQVDLSDLNAGIYVVVMENGKQGINKKILIQ